jgi:hypothetical protein
MKFVHILQHFPATLTPLNTAFLTMELTFLRLSFRLEGVSTAVRGPTKMHEFSRNLPKRNVAGNAHIMPI